VLVAAEGWHSGVLGIVAGRLKDKFDKPAFAIGFENGIGRGSARSVAGIDIGSLVRAAREGGVLANGGGHAMAAGFTVAARNTEPLRDFLMAQFAGAGMESEKAIELELHGIVSAAGANAALVQEIGRAGPYGAGNPEPVLVAPDLRVAFADTVGNGHIRLRLQGSDGAWLQGIAFRAANGPLGDGLLKSRGRRIHAAGTLRLDHWNGQERVQLQLLDAAPAAA